MRVLTREFEIEVEVGWDAPFLLVRGSLVVSIRRLAT